MITAYYNGNSVLIYDEVAKELDIKNGYRIKTEKELRYIIYINSSFGLIKCQTDIESAREHQK